MTPTDPGGRLKRRLSSKRNDAVLEQEEIALKEFPIRHTLTNDNGTEFNGHEELTASTGARVFFTHPTVRRNAAPSKTRTLSSVTTYASALPSPT